MNPIQTDNKGRSYIAKGGSIPQTTLKIPMPPGAKPPPPAPVAAKSGGGGNKGK
jgi:hypothetical protein